MQDNLATVALNFGAGCASSGASVVSRPVGVSGRRPDSSSDIDVCPRGTCSVQVKAAILGLALGAACVPSRVCYQCKSDSHALVLRVHLLASVSSLL